MQNYSEPASKLPLTAAAATHLPLIEEADAPAEVRALYAEFRQRFGRQQIAGILKCFATHPPLLRHMIGLAETMLFSEGALGRANKELLATYLSVQNGCPYCADSHGSFLLVHGGSPGLLQAAITCDQASPDLSPAQQALVRFVDTINRQAGRLQDGDIEGMRAAGWTHLQISEAIHLAALFACFNRVVSAFGLPSQNLLETTSATSSTSSMGDTL